MRAAFACDKLNYLMLMMVDPDVHFHVLPRYAVEREFGGVRFTDPGWPKVPNLGHENELARMSSRACVFIWLRAGNRKT